MIRYVAPRPCTFVVLIALVFASVFCLLACRRGVIVHAAERASAAGNKEPARRSEAAARQASSAGTTPVLVELFTSEGCSSCPTADALLARLQRVQPVPDADILALEEHVDYWDSLGWRDRFSSQQFSARQTAYIDRLRLSSEYTPQMIVDGTDQFAGNDVVHALRSIAHAASTPKLALSLSSSVSTEIASQARSAVPPAGRFPAQVRSLSPTPTSMRRSSSPWLPPRFSPEKTAARPSTTSQSSAQCGASAASPRQPPRG